MKRSISDEAAENKETHWIDDELQCVLQAAFPCFRVDRLRDILHLQALRIVSRQLARLIDQWLIPRIRSVRSDVFVLVHSRRRALFTGLRYLNLTDALSADRLGAPLDLTPYTQLRYLEAIQVRDEPMHLPTTLRRLKLTYVGGRCTMEFPSLPCLKRLEIAAGSHSLILRNLDLLAPTLRKLKLNMARLQQPGDLARLTRLVSLSLRNNHQLHDADVAPLTGLLALDLAACHRLRGDALRGMTQLRKLCLAANDRVSEAVLYALPQLRQLVLDDNIIIGGGPLAHMTRLRTLSVRRSGTILPRELLVLTQLTALDVHQALEPLQELDWLTRLPCLQCLCTSTPHLLTAAWMTRMTALRHLELGHGTKMTQRAYRLIKSRGGSVYSKIS